MKRIELLHGYLPLAFLIILAGAWILGRGQIISSACAPAAPCIFYPEDWPQVFGITPSSSPFLVGLLVAVLFALPFGRSGLLATLVGINIGKQAFGFPGMLAIFLCASLASVIGVHGAVEKGLNGALSGRIRKRLEFFEKLLAPSIKKHPFVSLALGNLAGSQWHMSALAVFCGVEREKAWLGLMAGNLAGFALILLLGDVPGIDAVSIMLIIVAATLAVSTPALVSSVQKAFAKK